MDRTEFIPDAPSSRETRSRTRVFSTGPEVQQGEPGERVSETQELQTRAGGETTQQGRS